jgi:hypothetical protein
MKDNPQNQSTPPPDSGGKKPKLNLGYLFEIYGDKPFMVREGEPFKNLFPDDPDRTYRNRNDFDIDRE